MLVGQVVASVDGRAALVLGLCPCHLLGTDPASPILADPVRVASDPGSPATLEPRNIIMPSFWLMLASIRFGSLHRNSLT